MWRTGGHTRSTAVRAVHQLADNEKLLGWLYVGGVPEDGAGKPPRTPIDPEDYLTVL